MDYEGKTVIVAGGSSGIGHAVAEEFLSQGSQDIYSFDIERPRTRLEHVLYRRVDVRNPRSIMRGLSSIRNPIDYLVNSAGVRENETLEGIRKMFDVNVNGAFYLFHLSEPKLSDDATIVQVSSDLARSLPKQNLGYALSKLASYNVAKQFAVLHPEVRVKIALPGPIDTPLFRRGKTKEEISHIKPRSPQYLAERILKLIESDKQELVCKNDVGIWTHELQ